MDVFRIVLGGPLIPCPRIGKVCGYAGYFKHTFKVGCARYGGDDVAGVKCDLHASDKLKEIACAP